MKHFKSPTLISFTLLIGSVAHATLSIDTSLVGDIGNQADSTGFGAVSYDYYIGTYEVTNTQYTSFLNAVAATDTHGLYNTSMGSDLRGGISRSGSSGSYSYSVISGFENRPVNFVSFWDAARFTNWLTTGNTETGVYILTSDGILNNTITRDATAWANGGVAVASGDEWYKAAYYKGGSTNAGYWDYAHQSDSITTADANYANSQANLTPVGSYGAAVGPYGTFDQGGNVGEWTEEISGLTRRVRGGTMDQDATALSSVASDLDTATSEFSGYGFRVSSLELIPEPSSYAMLLGGLALVCVAMRRKV